MRAFSRNDPHPALHALMAVGALQAAAGAPYWNRYSRASTLTREEWIFVGSWVLYLILAWAARRVRLTALVSAFAAYLWLVSYVGDWNPRKGSILMDGRLIEIAILGIFLWALRLEIRNESLRKRL